MSDDVLDLDKLVPEKQLVELDGRRYELTEMVHLGLRDQKRAERHFERLTQFEQAEELSDVDEAEYLDRIADVVRMALPDVPADVLDGLQLVQRQQVVAAFFDQLQLTFMERLLRVMARASAGASSSPASNGSTAATPTTG